MASRHRSRPGLLGEVILTDHRRFRRSTAFAGFCDDGLTRRPRDRTRRDRAGAWQGDRRFSPSYWKADDVRVEPGALAHTQGEGKPDAPGWTFTQGFTASRGGWKRWKRARSPDAGRRSDRPASGRRTLGGPARTRAAKATTTAAGNRSRAKESGQERSQAPASAARPSPPGALSKRRCSRSPPSAWPGPARAGAGFARLPPGRGLRLGARPRHEAISKAP